MPEISTFALLFQNFDPTYPYFFRLRALECLLTDWPFKRVAVDIVGPIEPRSDKKSRYILTMIDYVTRYPEAVALLSIETERIVEALAEMFSKVGGARWNVNWLPVQFTSEVMKEVSRLLSLQQLTTSVRHPMCNGLI